MMPGKSTDQELNKPLHKPGQHGSDEPLSTSLEENITAITGVMGVDNVDVIVRKFIIGTKPEPTPAAIIYIDGLANTTVQQFSIIQPLLYLGNLRKDEAEITPENLANYIRYCLISTPNSSEATTRQDVINKIITGDTAILVEGLTQAIVIDTKSWEHRGVSDPKTESSVRGPHEAFTETIRVNTALIRRRIRSPHLRIDMMRIGRRSHTDVAVIWIDGITNPNYVHEVKKRLNAVDVDILPYEGMLEEYIEDNPFSPFPQVQITERPDRVAAAISEGRVAILIDGNPMAQIVPTTFSTYFQTGEDYTERWMYASLLRILRLFSLINSSLLPALYIAITNYHQEMLPTPLALAFAAARENVPLPAFIEALIMVLALELVREAGLRLPSPVGSTVGIVGALLLGEAAVSANLASPIMVIVVALSGLSSFILPQYSQGLVLRFLVYPFILLSAGWGLFGMTAGIMVVIIHLSNLTSLGVPYLEPLWRPTQAFRDTFLRVPMWLMQKRPGFLRPRDQLRQRLKIRTWEPAQLETDQTDQGQKGQ
ncbi:MAG: spore germination protein [Firmicutes bacterium]|nr:spore germination protein [Bacillota bacterium]